jgi:glycerol-3-phosphate dehydrogenase
VWARDPEVVEAINTEHENTRYFKGHALPHCIRATTDKQGAITSSSGTVLILLVVPTPAIAAVVADLKAGRGDARHHRHLSGDSRGRQTARGAEGQHEETATAGGAVLRCSPTKA